MLIRFVYTVDTSTGAQLHEVKRDIEVPGEGGAYGNPSYKQLGQAEQLFRAWFLSEYGPRGKLVLYEAVPADGSKGRFCEYRAYLAVN
jgi:hypothetical protein